MLKRKPKTVTGRCRRCTLRIELAGEDPYVELGFALQALVYHVVQAARDLARWIFNRR